MQKSRIFQFPALFCTLGLCVLIGCDRAQNSPPPATSNAPSVSLGGPSKLSQFPEDPSKIAALEEAGFDLTRNADGLVTEISIVSDEPIEITMGLDTNRNGQLDFDEIDSQYTQQLCNGINGEDGIDGIDGLNGDGTVCIRHNLPRNSNIDITMFNNVVYSNEWFVVLQLTLSEYVHHVYQWHNGSSSNGEGHDSWYNCNPDS